MLRLGLGTHPWACWGFSLLLVVLALTSCLHVPGCKGSACLGSRKGMHLDPLGGGTVGCTVRDWQGHGSSGTRRWGV